MASAVADPSVDEASAGGASLGLGLGLGPEELTAAAELEGGLPLAHPIIGPDVVSAFDSLLTTLDATVRERRQEVQMVSIVNDKKIRKAASEDDALGRRLATDEFVGDMHLRTLRALLKKIDERGFER